jgi:hypothetical protein
MTTYAKNKLYIKLVYLYKIVLRCTVNKPKKIFLVSDQSFFRYRNIAVENSHCLLSEEYLRDADAYNIWTVGCRTAGLYSKSPVFNPNKNRHCKNKVTINTRTQKCYSSCQEFYLHLEGRNSNLDRDVDSPYDFGDFTQSPSRVDNSASNMP